MLVKVKSKVTGVEQFITPKAYNLAKKNYVFLGNAEDGADIYNPNPTVESQAQAEQSIQQVAESPNLKPQAQEKEKVAVPVAGKQPKTPKSKQTSSPTATVEV